MTNTVRRAIVLSLSTLSLLAAAAAPAHAAPAAGSYELRLDNAIYPGVGLGFFGLTRLVPAQGSNTTYFGAGAGLGYFLTDNFEIGGTLTYLNLDGDVEIPGARLFARGLTMLTPTLAGFVEGVLGYQLLVPDQGSNRHLATVGADVGVEKFMTESWALRLHASYRYLAMEESSLLPTADSDSHALGLGWAIAAYF